MPVDLQTDIILGLEEGASSLHIKENPFGYKEVSAAKQGALKRQLCYFALTMAVYSALALLTSPWEALMRQCFLPPAQGRPTPAIAGNPNIAGKVGNGGIFLPWQTFSQYRRMERSV